MQSHAAVPTVPEDFKSPQIGPFFATSTEKKEKLVDGKKLSKNQLDVLHVLYTADILAYLKNPRISPPLHSILFVAVSMTRDFIRDGYTVDLNQEELLAYNSISALEDEVQKQSLVSVITLPQPM